MHIVQKMAPKISTGTWSRFMAPVSGAFVMGIRSTV